MQNYSIMNDLKTTTSDVSVTEAVDRMVTQIETEGWHLFARIDHAKEARQKGLELRPTELILFGNPEIGTKLMQDQQISAIDLPMKALVWQDEQGQTRMACNDIKWIKERHGLTDDETIDKIAGVVESVCSVATQK
jgi:uncharacterized protein (DUF302 family)